ncbi:MAG TPA: S8 family serine peptidase [Blastocatellia bacterium]|nr:S8 family serine peptidase [Blastocatellia bacterium]
MMRSFSSPLLKIVASFLLAISLATSAFAGITFTPGQGVILTGAEGVILTGAEGVILTGAEGVILTGAEGVILTGAEGVILTGAEALTYIGPDGVILTGAEGTGIRSLDPELAFLLDALPDTSFINVFITFHRMPTQEDFNALRAAGILGGTQFRNLPMVIVNATRQQIARISTLPSVRSIYSNKTLGFLSNQTRATTGQTKVQTDARLTQHNGGLPVSGRGVTVAVLDTGVDTTHPDLAERMNGNVMMADLQGIGVGFSYPITLEGLPNTDLVMGHGTHIAGLIAGTGAASNGRYGGMAPGARLLGVCIGSASLFHVLAGIDYILTNRAAQNIRVVNCSFGIDGVFDQHDPVNIATKILHDAGVAVVFSAGNRGDQPNALNPYAVAPWVIGVGSVNKAGSLSSFSSRGAAGYGLYHPTLVAPGEQVVSTRAIGVNLVSTVGLATSLISATNDLTTIPLLYLPRYTNSSGTSFAAPHVAGTIALMLEANPQLTPDQIKRILQETATPMLGYSRYEVGAGSLNTYAAVRKAAFGMAFGQFRPGLNNAGVSHSRDALIPFSGTVAPGSTQTMTFEVPADAAIATAQALWTPEGGLVNGLTVKLARGGKVYESKPAVQLGGPRLTKTGVTAGDPEAGTWTLSVRNNGNFLTGSSIRYSGAIEVIRASYDSQLGLDNLAAAQQQAAKRALRAGLLAATANGFAGDAAANRLELARAVMLAAGTRVPQHLAETPTFVDVSDPAKALFVESVTHSPHGNLLNATGANFDPQGQADRLTAAVAAVKTLYSQSQINAASLFNPGLTDWATIPSWARGYVALAVSNNLLRPRGGAFAHNQAITRLELAEMAVALQQAAR